MVGLDVLTTLVVATKTLYDAAQEAKESHEECFTIHMTVSALENALKGTSDSKYTSTAMQKRLEEITKCVSTLLGSGT